MNKLKKRLSIVMIALGMMVLGQVPNSVAKTRISFLHKWPEPVNMAFYKKAVTEFEAANPDIEVKMEAVADEPYKDKIRVLMTSNQMPDIFFSWSGEFGRKFARSGHALDITNAVYQTDWKNRFSEAALGPFKFKGRLFGIPVNVDSKFMVYNKAIFKRLGLSKPQNWQQFMQMLATIKKQRIIPIAFGNQYPWAASHYIGDLNAKLVPNDIRLSDYQLISDEASIFTHPGYVRTLKEFTNLQKKGYFNRGSNALTHAIARGSLTAGRSAMMYLELVEFTELGGSRLERDGWDYFALPGFKDGEGNASLLTGAPDGFIVSSTSPRSKQAIKFLKFLTSREQAEKYVKMTGMTSAVKGSVTAANANQSIVNGLKTLDQAENLALWLDTDMDARIAEVYLNGSQAVLNGTETPEQVMVKVRKMAITVKRLK